MNYYERVQNSIDYIEENLKSEYISQYQNSQVKVKSFPGGQYAVMSTRLEQIESS